MLVVLHLRTFCHGKANALKDINDLLTHKREGMACTQSDRVWGTGKVELFSCCFCATSLYGLTQFVDACLIRLAEGIQRLTYLTLLLFRHLAKLVEEFGD